MRSGYNSGHAGARQEFDIAVIGAGSAGPKAARTAAKMGAKVVIFEEALIGGECLYTGCVPSKALIHSATLWNRMRRASEFGLPEFAGRQRRTSARSCATRGGPSRTVGGRQRRGQLRPAGHHDGLRAGAFCGRAHGRDEQDADTRTAPSSLFSAPARCRPSRPFPAWKKPATTPTGPFSTGQPCRSALSSSAAAPSAANWARSSPASARR